MYKKIMIGLVFILMVISFSGCTDNRMTEDKTSGDTDKIELVGYSVESQKCITGGFGISYQKIADGFVYSDDVCRYFINGTIKNIADEFFDSVIVHASFLDDKGSIIQWFNDTVEDIASGDTKYFQVWNGDSPTSVHTKDVRFEFEVV